MALIWVLHFSLPLRDLGTLPQKLEFDPVNRPTYE